MHSHDEEPEPLDLSKPYAQDEVTIPMLGKAGVALILFFLVNLALAGGAYYVFVTRETQQPVAMFGPVPKAPDPNVPILQKDPVADIHKFRADEYNNKHMYAHWKDGDNKDSLRIPVDRAMEIIKQSGLPAAAPATGGAALPATTAGQGNSMSPTANSAAQPAANTELRSGGVPPTSGVQPAGGAEGAANTVPKSTGGAR